MTLVVAKPYRAAFDAAGLRTLGDVLERATCIRDLDDRSNHEVSVGDLRVFVKRAKHRRFRRLVAREARGIRRARETGVRTADIVFEGLDRKWGAATGTRDLAPARPLDAALRDGVGFRQARAITFDLARQVASLHGAGLHHKDLYLNHVFVHLNEDPVGCTLIDCERVDSHNGTFSRWVIKDLAALESSAIAAGISRVARRRFALAYLSARGEDVDLFLKNWLPRVEAKARRIAAHTPRTPVGEAGRRPRRGSRMKLGVLLDHMPEHPGGAEGHTRALLLRAVETGDAAALATMSGRAPDGVETIAVRARGGRPERDQAFARDGVRALRDAGCDVVFAIRHAPTCDVYLPHGGLVDEARAAKDRSTGGASWHTRLARRFSRKHDWFREVERSLLELERGPLVISVSEALRQRIVRYFPACAHRIVTVVNGVDASHFDPEPFSAARVSQRATWGWTDRYVSLLLAHNTVLKGVETALQAMCADEARELNLGLVIAGGSLPRRLRAFVRREGLSASVREVGAVADPRVLYAAADVLVHPTWYDPCSLVCLEALAMGVPVITTPINGVREVMGQRGGIVVEEPGDPQAIAVALRVLSDPSLRAATADDARYLALRNRQTTRLDRVLDLCRTVSYQT